MPAPSAAFMWGELDGVAFGRVLDECYEEVVHWKHNVVFVPAGSVGKAFVDEVARLYQSYADNDVIEPIALKACMVMQVLLLQKPRKQSKAKEHSDALSRRLTLRKNGQISSLFEECCSIQARLPSSHNTTLHENVPKKFAKFTSMGKIREGLRCIEDNTVGGVLNVNDIIDLPNSDRITVLDQLKQLHPPA